MTERIHGLDKRLARAASRNASLAEYLSQVTPEMIQTTGQLADNIQGLFVDIYGLQDLDLKRASQFLWPRRSSSDTEGEIIRKKNNPRGACYANNGLRFRYAYSSASNLLFKAKDYLDPKRILLEAGRLPFERVEPVIYIPPSFMETLHTADPSQLFLERIDDLEVVTEEVGHFLYDQVQYKTHNQISGPIMNESMAILDWYLLTKKLSGESTVREDASNHSVLSSVSGKISLRENLSGNDPYSYDYQKSAWLIKGFVEYLERSDSSRGKMQGELQRFYRLSGTDKLLYLMHLYSQLTRRKGDTYDRAYRTVKEFLTFEPEFGRILFGK